MAAILIADLGDDSCILGIVARRVERADPGNVRLREGVDLGVQVAVVEWRGLVEVEPAAQAMSLEHGDDRIVGAFAPRVRLEHEGYADTAVARADQSLGQRTVAEVIGCP